MRRTPCRALLSAVLAASLALSLASTDGEAADGGSGDDGGRGGSAGGTVGEAASAATAGEEERASESDCAAAVDAVAREEGRTESDESSHRAAEAAAATGADKTETEAAKSASASSAGEPSRSEEGPFAAVPGVGPARAGEAAPGDVRVEAHVQAVILLCVLLVGVVGVLLAVVCCTDDPQEAALRDPKNREMLELISKHYLPPCEACGTKHKDNRLCEACSVVAYCSEPCRASHAPRHAEVCGRLASLRAKHTERPPSHQHGTDAAAAGGGGGGEGAEDGMGNAMLKGYFVDWQADNAAGILKDVATFFVKYQAKMVAAARDNLPSQGRGLLLVDVSTERFKELHKACDPTRMMYLSSATVRANPRLALFACDTVAELLQRYDPGRESVVAFTNGLSYVEVMCFYFCSSSSSSSSQPTFLSATPHTIQCNTNPTASRRVLPCSPHRARRSAGLQHHTAAAGLLHRHP